MHNKEKLNELLQQAEHLLSLCKRLNFQSVAAHDPQAVASLHDVMRQLSDTLPRAGDQNLEDFARRQSGPTAVKPAEPAVDKAEVQERRRQCVESLTHAGLADRLGKVYSTDAATRQIALRDTPHKQGLPQFDMVVGADYSPQSGFHGIFIGSHEVMSCVLTKPFETQQWQIRERHRFSNLEQMADLVSMLSAGFPVP